MLACKIIGQAISTVKDKRLKGYTMLVVGRIDCVSGQVLDQFIALDNLGAGEGEVVGVIQGTPAQDTLGLEGVPVDAVVVAIFDSLSMGGKEVYKK